MYCGGCMCYECNVYLVEVNFIVLGWTCNSWGKGNKMAKGWGREGGKN